MSEYRAALKKLQKEEDKTDSSLKVGSNNQTVKTSGDSFMDSYRKELSRLQEDQSNVSDSITVGKLSSTTDKLSSATKSGGKKWYESGLFEDGYDFGDVTKTLLGISDKKELKTFTAPETTLTLAELKEKQKSYENNKWMNADELEESLKTTQQLNQKALYEYSQTLSKIKMDGTNRTVLEEIEILANMKSGKEKDERKQKVLQKMEQLGMDTAYYSHFAGDGEFDWNTFGKWLSDSAMAGLNTFNKGLLDTADLLLGAPMKAMGWENNPISEGAEYYDTLYNTYRYNANLNAEKLGGNAWNFGTDAIEGTMGSLPNTLLMFMTGGASATTTTSSLTTQAAAQTGNILTKAGLTTETMLKNPQYWMSFARTLGSDYKEAKEAGASDVAASVGSVLKSLINSGIEIGFDGGSGIQGLPSGLKEGGKPFWEWVESSIEEGGEEVLQKFVGEAIHKVGYGSDEEMLNPIEYAKEGMLGAISGAVLGAGQTAVQSGVNAYNTKQANKLTTMEQTVADKLVEKEIAKRESDGKTVSAQDKKQIQKNIENNLRKGYLKAEDIEEVLGGESYNTFKTEMGKFTTSEDYQNLRKATEAEKKARDEFDVLVKMKQGDMTGEQVYRRDELKKMLDESTVKDLRSKLGTEANRIMGIRNQMRYQVMDTVKDSRLAESYREMARKQQKFEVDVNKYTNENAKKTVQSILDSGLGDNSNQFHDVVDFLAKISADKNVTFNLTNNAKLEGTEHYKEGYITHGFINDNGDIVLNKDSDRVIQTTVGHEVTHVLEKAGIYKELSSAVRDFAISKEGLEKYNARLAAAQEAYAGKKNTTAEKEITADLIGEYLFTDSEFINKLSTSNRNVFQKIYDEIKYLCKVVTAGSKEARELEKVKKLFDQAWRENVKGKADSKDSVSAENEVTVDPENDADLDYESPNKYSVSVKDPETIDFLENQEHITTYKAMVMIDGKLYPPMASKVKGENGKYQLTNGRDLGEWMQAEEDTTNIKFNDKGVGYYDLKKNDGGTVRAAYNPYEHSSNLVLNDQFEAAYKRGNLVTVECVIPKSEIDNAYKAQYAKDSTGVMDWHSGVVAGKLTDNKRSVYLSRYLKAVRIVPDSEVAQMYKEIVGDLAVPFNVVSPSLLTELENAGVSIDYDGSPQYQYLQRKAAEKAKNTKYSMSKDSDGNSLTEAQTEFFKNSKVRNESGELTPMYHGTPDGSFNEFKISDTLNTIMSAQGAGYYFTNKKNAEQYMKPVNKSVRRGAEAKMYEVYLNITNPMEIRPYERTITKEQFKEVLRKGNNNWFKTDWMPFYLPGDKYTNQKLDFETLLDQYTERIFARNRSDGEILAEITRAFQGGDETILKAMSEVFGNDGVHFIDRYGDIWVAWSANQIKNIDNQNPTENPDIRYSMTKDAKQQSYHDYLEAVNSGDTDTAQKLLDDFAKEAGYNYRGVHRSFANFTVFDREKIGSNAGTRLGDGFYVTLDIKDEATARYADESYGKNRMDLYVKMESPLVLGDPMDESIINRMEEDFSEFGWFGDDDISYYAVTPEKIRKKLLSTDGYEKMETIRLIANRNYMEISELLKQYGFDSVIDENDFVKQAVVYDENQLKSAEPVTYDEYGDVIMPYERFNPDNMDIRFSLSKVVEETKDLMALHNLHSSELLKQLQMGGMPYPSVAITKPDMVSHDNYGEISLILHKNAIDPKTSKYNKIYSADAYTPTFPNVDYEASEDVAERISSLVNKHYYNLPDYYQRSVRALRDYSNIDDELNRWGGEQRYVEKYADDYGLKQLYLAERGETVPVETKRTEKHMTDYQKRLYSTVVDKIGVDVLSSFNEKGEFDKLGQARMAWLEKHGNDLKAIYAEDWSADGTITYEEAMDIANEQNRVYWKDEIIRALNFVKTGGITVTESEDISSTNAEIDKKISGSDFKDWVAKLFSGIEGKSGIRNNKDIFTPSGKRRSFDQTHDPLTVDNIVKVMRKENQTGQGAFGGGSILGASAQEYGSIEVVKRNSDRLGTMDTAEHDAVKDQINEKFWDIARRYANGKDIIDAQETIAEAVSKNESKAGIARYLKQYDYVYQYTDDIGDEIIALRDYIRSLPTPYFEAKPRRGVGFDEVAAFVIPRNADIKLKQELLSRGYNIAEYDPDVEGDRNKVVNQFEEYKFSLSPDNGEENTYGDFRNKWSDFGYHDELDDFTPIREDVAKNAKNAAPDLFPENFNTPQMELDNLNQEKEALENSMLDMSNSGDFSDMPRVDARWKAVRNRIAELEKEISATDSERLNSIGDEDAPPEIDVPYYGDDSDAEVPDPFADRDMHEVGSKKVKAYQYENPEVKPYFTEAALGMLDDLHSGTKGERLYNDELHYASGGEKGWMGTKRHTTPDIAALLDQWHYTYAEIEDGLNAIIEDDGKENNAVSKRIEFMLHDRLVNGYTGVWGDQIPPNSEYVNFLKEKEISEYSSEVFDSFMATADMYAPVGDISPVKEDADATTDDKTEVVEEKAPAHRRREKSKEYTEFWADLIGDTSTWKDMRTGLQYKTKTLRRILRHVVKDGRGNPDIGLADAIYDELETKYDHNEALLKKESARLKEAFKNLKLSHAEDQYAQMLGELRYNPETTLTEDVVKEYLNKHKGINEAKVNRAIEESRKLYDDLIVRVNEVLREQGFKEIPYRKGYFPHFTNPKQNWVAKLLNWKTIDTEIPTSIAGLTEMFKPNRSWQKFNKQRMGDKTDYSLYQGLDSYIHGALDWIYHIEDLQKRRSLENYIRYTHSDEGVKQRINEILNSNYDADEAQTMINAVLDEAHNPLSGLVRELMNRTNTLANKKSSVDRGMEDMLNRKIYSTMTNLNNRITANMVVGSFSSAMTNFIPMVQSWHQVSPWYTVRGIGDTVRSAIKDDGTIAKSDFLTNRLMEEEKLYKTGWDKASDVAAFMMNTIDSITSQTVWRSKYLQNLKEGMSEAQAIRDADQFAKNLMAGRSRGNAPTIFDAKNPLVKIFTAFQLEVANQYGYMLEDVPQDSKNMARMVKGYATAFLGAYAYNALYSTLVGRDAAFDPISIIEDLMKGLLDDDDEEDDLTDDIMDFGKDVLQEVPFVGGLLGGGRVPLSSAFPYSGYSNPVESMLTDLSEGELSKEWLKPLYYLVLPFGGGQLKKTNEGLGMFSEEHPIAGSYTASGNLRFPVDDTIGNRIQAAMFGQYASENARDYFDNDRSALKPAQIEEFADLDIPIRDYWDYREGLAEYDKWYDKADYIANLDLPIDKRNILINNISTREDPIDLRGYENFSNYEEFDWAKQYPEKYEFFKEIGVSVQDYKDADEETKADYNWAYKYPQYVTLSKAISNDPWEYRGYYKDMTALKADKDANGKSISGSKKAKVIDYINGLSIDYGAKLVLFKSQYEADDTYNKEVFEYIRDKESLTFEDKLSILKTLGYGVSDDGTITWD